MQEAFDKRDALSAEVQAIQDRVKAYKEDASSAAASADVDANSSSDSISRGTFLVNAFNFYLKEWKDRKGRSLDLIDKIAEGTNQPLATIREEIGIEGDNEPMPKKMHVIRP